MKTQIITLNQEQNVTLSCYLYDKSAEYPNLDVRPAVLIFPGGGYAVCSDKEAEPIALGYTQAGYNAFVLRYTLKSVKPWPAPLNDYEKAMETILSHAEEWGIDKKRIAVAGFSAGGHLAACAATIAVHKPAAAILGYAALTEETVSLCGKDIPIPIDLVDSQTAPCFLFSTRTDNVAPIQNTLSFMQKLNDNGISFESHIYSYGPHGFGTGENIYNQPEISDRAKTWLKDSVKWLGEYWGERTYTGYSAPKFERTITGNGEKNLSLSCTYLYLQKQRGEAEMILQPVFEKINTLLKPNISATVLDVISKWVMRDIMPLIGFSVEDINAIDEKLRQITNVR